MMPSLADNPGVSRETQQRLSLYQNLLIKWQARINLVSPSTLADAQTRHFEDSLQLLPLIPETANTLYDLGSGAGFPGMVLAMARPDMAVTLIESDGKKTAFLKTVSRETKTTVSIENDRIEGVALRLPPPDIVTARALAPLADLLDFCGPWLHQNPALIALFPKGARCDQEVADAREKGWIFDLEATFSQTSVDSRILKLRHIRKG